MEHYISPISGEQHESKQLDMVKYDQQTPKRITIEYQTTEKFKNISTESGTSPTEDLPG